MEFFDPLCSFWWNEAVREHSAAPWVTALPEHTVIRTRTLEETQGPFRINFLAPDFPTNPNEHMNHERGYFRTVISFLSFPVKSHILWTKNAKIFNSNRLQSNASAVNILELSPLLKNTRFNARAWLSICRETQGTGGRDSKFFFNPLLGHLWPDLALKSTNLHFCGSDTRNIEWNVWKFCLSGPLNPRPSASEIRGNVTKMFTVLWTAWMPASGSEPCLASSRERNCET